mgnify:CR=1 FL=1
MNVTMQVGQLAETVTVQGQVPQVETRSIGVSTVMAATSELPLNARQSTDLITLSGLAVQTGTAPAYTMNTGVNISVAGSTSYSIQHNLDGASHLDVYTGTGHATALPRHSSGIPSGHGRSRGVGRRPCGRIGQCRDQVRDESGYEEISFWFVRDSASTDRIRFSRTRTG